MSAPSQPYGYVSNKTDCNDTNASVHPGATEIAGDNIDQDCNGSDLQVSKTWYQDYDGDGYGNPNQSKSTTFMLYGYVLDNTDCNDMNASIHPGATEIAGDGIDQDCDGIDETSTSNIITIESDFSFKLSDAIYKSLLGDMSLWLDFKFFGEQSGILLWELENLGTTTSAVNPITIASDLSFNFDATYSSLLGDMDLTVNFKFFGDQSGKLLWKLDSYTVPDPGTPPDPTNPVTNSLGMTFAYIAPGTFTMGSPEDESDGYTDETQHQVTLTQGYYMQTTEVTQGQWQAVVGSNPSSFSSCGSDCPVDQVSWNDVQAFINKLNQKGEGTYSLPTEAQWEYAARAGSTTAFANGEITETNCGYDPNLDAMGWYCYNSGSTPHPVAQKTPNAWGLYDMHGNVSEWCQDWYDSDYYNSGFVTDPAGPSSGSKRVFRGGSWSFLSTFCRSARRKSNDPDSAWYGSLGFRLALSPGQQ